MIWRIPRNGKEKRGEKRIVEGLTGRMVWTTKRRLTVLSLLASSVDSSLDWQCDQLSAPAGITDRPPVFCQASVPACCSIPTCKHTHTFTHQSPILPPTQLSKRAQLNNESGHIPWRKGSREGKLQKVRSLRILKGKPKTNLSPFNPSLHSHRGTRQQYQQKFSYPSISCHK